MNPDPSANHYELLGVPMDATCHQVAQMRRSLSRRFHTDNGAEPDGELMARINHAIDVLGDRDKRRRYDELLWETGRREARAEAEQARQARAREIRAEEVEAFRSALAGDRATEESSVAPPSGRSGHAPVDEATRNAAGVRAWPLRGRRPGASRRRAPGA